MEDKNLFNNATKQKTKKRSLGFQIAKIIVFILFAVYSLSLIYSFLWAISASLKSNIEFRQHPNGFPTSWQFSNYSSAFNVLEANGNGMLKMMFNSLWYTVGGAVLGVVVSSMVAYVVAKYDFVGKKFIYSIALLSMMIPIVGAMPSQFKVYESIGILNTPFMILSFAGGFGFNFVVLYSFFKSLPWTYAEAGFIDGASNLKVFLVIMMPQALSVLGALLIVAGIGLWNDSITPLLFLKEYPTLASGLYIFQISSTRFDNYPILFAGLLLSVLPVVVIFILFQNTLMDMSIAGGLKG